MTLFFFRFASGVPLRQCQLLGLLLHLPRKLVKGRFPAHVLFGGEIALLIHCRKRKRKEASGDCKKFCEAKNKCIWCCKKESVTHHAERIVPEFDADPKQKRDKPRERRRLRGQVLQGTQDRDGGDGIKNVESTHSSDKYFGDESPARKIQSIEWSRYVGC